MSTAFVGQIMMFGGNFPPRGTAFCNGQLLPIAENTALYNLIGTTYGGDGQSTFGLPDLRSRLPLHQGQGSGLTSRSLGEVSGTSVVTLTAVQMPSHSHNHFASSANASAAAIGNTLLPAKPTVTDAALYATSALETNTLASGAVSNAGGSLPHDNLMPSLCISFVIVLEGLFPSQN
jgi:microcystin-dependent protein